MIEASCHCGAVRFTVDAATADVNDCNCSICRRLGALWAYYQKPQVRFAEGNGPTDVYTWRERRIEFHRCHTCGCTTYWLPADPTGQRLGVNARLLPPEVLAA